jgi:hypothetical protein
VRRNRIITLLIGIILLSVIATPALSHHSFAMYDQSKTKTMSGKLTRFSGVSRWDPLPRCLGRVLRQKHFRKVRYSRSRFTHCGMDGILARLQEC